MAPIDRRFAGQFRAKKEGEDIGHMPILLLLEIFDDILNRHETIKNDGLRRDGAKGRKASWTYAS